MRVTKDRRTTERKPVMRTFLMIAGLAGLLASSTAAFAASGPGNSDHTGNDQNRIVLADNGRSDDWGRPNNLPWNNPQGPGSYGYNSGWQDSGHNQPSWGYGHQQYQPLPRQVIRARLQHQQFRDLSNWRFKDGYYRVNAEDRHGHDVKLTVDAYTGQIVKVRRD
jgi:hypothetical protein